MIGDGLGRALGEFLTTGVVHIILPSGQIDSVSVDEYKQRLRKKELNGCKMRITISAAQAVQAKIWSRS